MKTLDAEWRLQALSHYEIAGELDVLVRQLSSRHKFKGRKLKSGPLLNALALWFLRLGVEERERFLARALTDLEQFLSQDENSRQEAEPLTIGSIRDRTLLLEAEIAAAKSRKANGQKKGTNPKRGPRRVK